MNYKKLDSLTNARFVDILQKNPLLVSIAQEIDKRGGFSLVVGGAVRDLFLNLAIKDIDVEVHNISLEELEKILRGYGPVSLIGKIYGVLRLHGLDIDWSVPRLDAGGRKPSVKLGGLLSVEQAFRRRDVTVNAMGINVLTHECVDPFNGLFDLGHHILRTPDPVLFVEDPLRFFRIMQFMARFAMEPDDQLNQLCATMDISGVSKERIEVECAKWLLKSTRPSRALLWLQKIKRLQEIFPEVAALKAVVQDPRWHPEGDVFEHTLQTIDAASQFVFDNHCEKLVVMYAALCHDLGKVSTTVVGDDKITSYGHAKESEKLASKLLQRIVTNKELIVTVSKLVGFHMYPLEFIRANAGPSAYKRLARKLAPNLTIKMLCLLVKADRLGRNPEKHVPLSGEVHDVTEFCQKAERYGVLTGPESPLLQGKDIMDIVKPGPVMGALLKEAYAIQLDEGIQDKALLKQRIIELLEKTVTYRVDMIK